MAFEAGAEAVGEFIAEEGAAGELGGALSFADPAAAEAAGAFGASGGATGIGELDAAIASGGVAGVGAAELGAGGVPGAPGQPGGAAAPGTSMIAANSVNPIALSQGAMEGLGISGFDPITMGEGFGGSGMVSGGFDPITMGEFAEPFSSGANFAAEGMGDAAGGFSASDAYGLKSVNDTLKKLGLSPATAAMLGISGAQALSKPQIPDAAKRLAGQAGPGADAASAVVQSGGTSSPAWGTQKSAIDASIDQQIQQQAQALVQQAQNSGMGADSEVTVQQINKLKTDLEGKRQQLYAQAQQQNVQAALSALGINDQALAQVAQAEFAGSAEAKASASQTAQNAMMLQALSQRQAA